MPKRESAMNGEPFFPGMEPEVPKAKPDLKPAPSEAEKPWKRVLEETGLQRERTASRARTDKGTVNDN